MGMFDDFEPAGTIPCPACGTAVIGWQGKDGPCALFVWRQGSRHPVDQPIDPDCRLDPERFADFTLPDEFDLYGTCANGHWVDAVGRCVDGIWSETDTLPSAAALVRKVTEEADRARRKTAWMATHPPVEPVAESGWTDVQS